jgi:stress response protein SCP2
VSAHDDAEREFDRSPETRADLEQMYLLAAHAVQEENHPDLGVAWLGLATLRRYQKGRREDALAAFDAALAAAPNSLDVWDAYLDYITYAVSAAALIGIVERMPASIRAQMLWRIVSVGRGTDRWGTMSSQDQKYFVAELPGVLERLGDQPSLGTLLSDIALREYRDGSHDSARDLMRRAVATGHPSPACVDRLSIDLVKQGEKAEAAVILQDALGRPIPSDSLRAKLTKRLARCSGPLAAADSVTAQQEIDDLTVVESEPVAESPTPFVRHLMPGENAVVAEVSWRAQVGWHDPANTVDVDACALLLDADGRIAADTDFVFYNQLVSPDGSVRHGGEQALGTADLFEEIKIDLPVVPARVSRVVICASLHEGTFADVVGLHVRLEGDPPLVFEVPRLSTERAVVLFEFYRRGEAWKVRAIGQGYDDGLAGLAREYGVDVD